MSLFTTVLTGTLLAAESTASTQIGWHSFGLALLVTLGVVAGFFLVHSVNVWLHRRLTRSRQVCPPSDGKLETGNGS